MNPPAYTRIVCKNTFHNPEEETTNTMTSKTYTAIYTAILVCIFCFVDILALNVYWQHQAVVHHAARWEANAWGLTSFHWNDDSAQTPFHDPTDDLIPPPLKK